MLHDPGSERQRESAAEARAARRGPGAQPAQLPRARPAQLTALKALASSQARTSRGPDAWVSGGAAGWLRSTRKGRAGCARYC